MGGLAASTPLAQAEIIITEVNSNSNEGDFFELHNTGASAVDLTGWKWDDDSLTPGSGATFDSTSIPAGGVLVVSNGAAGTEAAFKTAWNLGGDVTVIATGGHGLGGNDVTNETSNTLTFYSVAPYTLQVLHLADVYTAGSIQDLRGTGNLLIQADGANVTLTLSLQKSTTLGGWEPADADLEASFPKIEKRSSTASFSPSDRLTSLH